MPQAADTTATKSKQLLCCHLGIAKPNVVLQTAATLLCILKTFNTEVS
jgi:hypothetical protein